MITPQDILSIVKLVVFIPFLGLAIFVCLRHGFNRGSGWFYLAAFCLIRIIGSAAQIATISDTTSTTPYTIAGVCASIGLSPLLLATLGLLGRVLRATLPKPYNTIYTLYVSKAIQIPTLIALILVIIGATDANTPEQIDSETKVQAGVALFLVVYIAMLALTICACIGHGSTKRGESLLIKVLVLALPFLLIRLIYSLLGVFSGMKTFSPIDGSVGIQVGLAFVEEVAVSAMYLWCGVRLADEIPDGERSGDAGQNLAFRARGGEFVGDGSEQTVHIAAPVRSFNSPGERGGRGNDRGRAPPRSEARPCPTRPTVEWRL